MIVNLINRENLMQITNSPFQCYMTGSRYFGGATPTSDYDFFAEDTREIVKWLEKNGYTLNISIDYTDSTISGIATKDNIQIQLVKPPMMRIKKAINDQLYRYRHWFMKFDKIQRKLIWQIMVDICVTQI